MLKSSVGRTPGRTIAAAGAVLLSTATLVACGESAQEKAIANVCSARKSISEQVTKLQGLPLTSSSVEEAKSGLETIGDELKKIRDAQPDLSSSRKEEVEAATARFGEQLKSIGVQFASALAAGTTESAVETTKPKLKLALEALAGDYRQALGPVSC